MTNLEFSLSHRLDAQTLHHVVAVTGEIDLTTVPALRRLLSALDGDVEINCESVTFIDSSGLGLFIGVHKALSERGQKLTLRRLHATCYKVFEITRLAEFLDVEGSTSPAS